MYLIGSKSFRHIETASVRLSYSSAREARVACSFRHRDCPISDAERHWTNWKTSHASHFLKSVFVQSVPLSRFQLIRKVSDLEPTLCHVAEVKPVPVKEVFKGAFNLKEEETWISHCMVRRFQPCSNVKTFWVQRIPHMQAVKIVERLRAN